MIKLTSVLAAASLMALTTSALASPFTYNTRQVAITDTETQQSLQQVINGVVGQNVINAATDQSRVGAWSMSEADVDAYRIALLSPLEGGTLGIFSLATGAEYTLLNATNLGTGYTAGFSLEMNGSGNYDLWIGGDVKDSNFGKAFGFFWQEGTNKSYTMDSKNTLESAQALAYLVDDQTGVTLHRTSATTTATTAKGGDDWILAFDNQSRDLVSGDIYDSLTDFNDAVFYMEDLSPVPEPGTMVLLGAGFLGLAIYAKRRKNA